MKTDYGWSSDGNGTNSSGFAGLPGGYRNWNGYFLNAGRNGIWWSSSPLNSNAWHRHLFYDDERVVRYVGDIGLGMSVRCVRDAE